MTDVNFVTKRYDEREYVFLYATRPPSGEQPGPPVLKVRPGEKVYLDEIGFTPVVAEDIEDLPEPEDG